MILAAVLVASTPSAFGVDFADDIRPLLNEHCVACHGGVKQAADISFIHRDAALSVIEPGEPDESTFIDRITSTDEYEVMPPPEHGHPLTKQQVKLFRDWIAEGAVWEQPWSYEGPRKSDPPSVENPDWCLTPIDAYVLARLEKEGIEPAPDAPAAQWLRRVTLDLTGIPPTPAQHDEFIAAITSDGAAAYESKVDELLRDPGFGHRWASVWLDQIRYADSRGLGLDGRREIWKYRDWVIKSLNDDMRFDDFTIKQIAGDLIPEPTINDRVATAASRLTQTNEEGGTDDEEFRIAAVMDRVSTVWQTWQGITFECVQCHSHPYDPINHEEYYKFAAFFNNSMDSDLNEEYPLVSVPLDPADEERASALDLDILRMQESIWQREYDLINGDQPGWWSIDDFTAESTGQTRVRVEQRAGHTEFATIDTLSAGTKIMIDAAVPKDQQTISALRMTFLPRDPESAKADSEWGFMLSYLDVKLVAPDSTETPVEFSRVIGDEPHPMKDPQQSLNAKNSDGFAAYSRIHYARTAAFILKEPISVPQGSRLMITLDNRAQMLGAFPLVTRRGFFEASSRPIFGKQLDTQALVRDRQQLKEWTDQRRKIPSSRTPVMAERPASLKRPTHVFIRGLFLTKGEQVQPGIPASLGTLSGDEQADRMTLAKWLVSPENPLTARVTVNRVWARIFGTGLVATEEDFGSSGERPSHPELLDHLALQFAGPQGFRIKTLVRSIVLSHTYRQSSMIREELQAGDPINRLLARGPRFRMPAEMVRDQALAASGLLADTFGGPPVYPPIPDGVWKPFSSGDRWNTAKVGDANRYRRTIYTYTKRSIPYPMMATFDAPSREFCNPRRLRSNTPLQALMTLNDATFVECAAALARRMESNGDDLDDQIRFGFLATASRPADDREMDSLRGLYRRSIQSGAKPDAAMNDVATVLLNLDEIMSK
ncbi:PSD1 and planctomycete cytochrome C domain-containing protein [Rubripirellula lacrimiformis]|nr:PSD1 and planctomycete cytochrome C domain-containing protein [Rubripirellula lacrimiformis]